MRDAPTHPAASPHPRRSGGSSPSYSWTWCGPPPSPLELDPEKLWDVLDSFHQATAETVARFDGRVVERRGDGMLACFGWPQAHEDDAERAVRAGLAAVEAWPGCGPPMPAAGVPGRCRHRSRRGRRSSMPGWRSSARPPHLAARLHALGPPGAVVLTEPTRPQLRAAVRLREPRPPAAQGLRDARGQAWRVMGDGCGRGRFEALRGVEPHAPGRAPRSSACCSTGGGWPGRRGPGGPAAGEAGIGKSRLVRALRDGWSTQPHTRWPVLLAASCQHRALPYLRLLERAAGCAGHDPPERQLDLLEAMLALAGEHEPEAAPLLADLLGIADTGRYPRPALTPARKKERTLRALLGQLTGLAARGPVLAVYDDVHWADPTTLELLRLVIDRVRRLPALVVITFRPEFVPPWTGYGHVTALPLQRLGQRDGARMIEEVTGGKAVPGRSW